MRLIIALFLLALCTAPVLAAEEPWTNYRDVVKTDDGGYVLVGTMETEIGKQADWPVYRGDITLERTDRNDAIVWNRSFGGEKNDEARGLIGLSDGGFLVFGQTESFGRAAWVIRTDAEGREQWNRTFGRGLTSTINAVVEMRNGGFALAGTSDAFSSKGQGAWLVRTDTQGTELWNRTFGGEVFDAAYSVAEYPEGGLVIAGIRNTNSGHLQEGLLIRTDSAGNTLWEKTYGGSGTDEVRSVVVTRHGEILFTGSSFSPGLTIDDFWVVKTDAEGNEIWNRKVAGKGIERGMAIALTSEDGYLVGEAVTAETWEIHLVTLDNAGTVLQENTYTGIDPGILSGSWCLSRLPDGSLILSGPGESCGVWALEMMADGTETGRHLVGMTTVKETVVPETTYQQPYMPGGWLVRTDDQGRELWNTTFGDDRMQEPFSLTTVDGGGYMVAGSAVNNGMHSDAILTFFDDGGQKTGRVILGSDGLSEIHSTGQVPDGGFILTGKHDMAGWESQTMWVIRIDKTGSRQWEKDIPDLPIGNGAHVIHSSDGGFVVSGSFQSQEHHSPDGIIVRTGEDGMIFWKQTFGGSGQDSIPSVSQTQDGGYIAIVATTEGYMADTFTSSATLVRLDEKGSIEWSRPLTESTQVEPRQVRVTSDGGFLVSGYAINGDSLVGPWIVKTDGSGNVLWHHVYDFGSYGLKGSELAVETPDGGYAMIGDKGGDIRLIRLDQSGTELWNASYGGWSEETARSLQVTSDGGFVIAGITKSYPVTVPANNGRIVPLFILFTAVLAAGLVIAIRKERETKKEM
jgi:regulation of enolase protein 1 (concanavalin A-like superfamily)